MALTNAYTVAVSRIPDLFEKIRDGQAPDQLTTQLLKDWGFTSSNDRALVPLLKALGFLSADGKPTSRYHDYRDHSRSKAIMGQAIREAYGDLFLIKEHPSESDKSAITGKFKSFHNASDHVAKLMSSTFFALLNLADLKASPPTPKVVEKKTQKEEKKDENQGSQSYTPPPLDVRSPSLHYNIQIHLPPTKDIEVYNAIFKSLKTHLLEN